MKNEQLKLEEFMYISIIGKFYATEMVNGNKFVSFVSVNKINGATPIYLTSGENYSELTLLNRVKAFEKKIILNKELLDKIYANETENKVNLVGRLRTYLESLSEDELKNTVKLYCENIESLKSEKFLEEDEEKLLTSYVEQLCARYSEDIKADVEKAERTEEEKELKIL